MNTTRTYEQEVTLKVTFSYPGALAPSSWDWDLILKDAGLRCDPTVQITSSSPVKEVVPEFKVGDTITGADAIDYLPPGSLIEAEHNRFGGPRIVGKNRTLIGQGPSLEPLSVSRTVCYDFEYKILYIKEPEK